MCKYVFRSMDIPPRAGQKPSYMYLHTQSPGFINSRLQYFGNVFKLSLLTALRGDFICHDLV